MHHPSTTPTNKKTSSTTSSQNSNPLHYDYIMKVIIIGDSGIGKSSLLLRYHQNKFITNYLMTIGINTVWNIQEIDDVRIKLQIWDTAGQEKYKTITQNYYRNSHGAIIAYSINSRDSFYSVRQWIDQLTQTVKQNIQIILVGTKNDLIQQRQIDRAQAEQFAKQHNIPYMECSAKSGDSVKDVFKVLTKMMKEKFIDEKIKNGGGEEEGNNGGEVGIGEKKVIHIIRYGKDMHSKCCQN